METLRESPGGISVILRGFTNVDPTTLASEAATTCYQAELPKPGGKLINIEQAVFMPGHHTTLQHWHANFAIDGLSVGDITFGLHLASPFYDTDQRSGRFCSAMFANPDFAALERYVRAYWPDVRDDKISKIIAYLKTGLDFYAENLEEATALSRKHLSEDRPNISEKNLAANAGKIAQEQMRMFIPIIFPTGFLYSINLSALFSQWAVAWSPTMRAITDMMRDLVLERNPELLYMFRSECRRKGDDWYPKIATGISSIEGCLTKPGYRLEEVIRGMNIVIPSPEDMHPIDLLHFKPEYMNNSDTIIKSRVFISCATMGQDQRHRTIRRSEPEFTRLIYLPPLLAEMRLDKKLARIMIRWREISSGIPETLATNLAPYGIVVSYRKKGDLNALAHEMAKRCCWCAQEEIYHLAIQMRQKVLEKNPDLEWLFAPPCISKGICGEGARYCGRDLHDLGFQKRNV